MRTDIKRIKKYFFCDHRHWQIIEWYTHRWKSTERFFFVVFFKKVTHKSYNNVLLSLAYGTLNTIDYNKSLHPNCIISKLVQSVCFCDVYSVEVVLQCLSGALGMASARESTYWVALSKEKIYLLSIDIVFAKHTHTHKQVKANAKNDTQTESLSYSNTHTDIRKLTENGVQYWVWLNACTKCRWQRKFSLINSIW